MPTAYVRRVSLKASLSDAEVAAYWKFTMEEVVPALQRVPGMRSVKVYSGAGGLRADIRYVFEMDDAGVYERLLADAQNCSPSSPKPMRPGICPRPVRRFCAK